MSILSTVVEHFLCHTFEVFKPSLKGFAYETLEPGEPLGLWKILRLKVLYVKHWNRAKPSPVQVCEQNHLQYLNKSKLSSSKMPAEQ